jgi:hypothetical protein
MYYSRADSTQCGRLCVGWWQEVLGNSLCFLPSFAESLKLLLTIMTTSKINTISKRTILNLLPEL